jgi:hypothetical protein
VRLRVESDGNDNTAERFQSVIKANDIWNDLLTQGIIEGRKLRLQPVEEFPGGASTRNVNGYPTSGIEQADECEIKTE